MYMKRIIVLILILSGYYADAQHQHDPVQQPKKAPAKKTVAKPVHSERAKPKVAADTMQPQSHHQHEETAADTMHNHSGHDGMMSHAYSRSLPMTRNGSGTAWLPDASPMYGYMAHAKKWMFMFHGNIFLRYNNQDFTNKGSRGDSKIDAPNWIMAMGQRQVGKNGLFHFSTMFSLDALIAGGSGYPLLFQTGESWKGKPLVDRQHPHDLFSELAVSYAHRLSPKADVFVYLGYPGEPSIGSVAFMHRPSALTNPDAPISHHWNDGTHITFGVATLGFRYGKFKLEGSSFTGREPDEERFDFDKPLFDSRSARLSFNPDKHWALQVSKAFVKSPEALHPGEDIDRTTASAVYSGRLGSKHMFNATALWGLNRLAGHDGEHALLAEANLSFNKAAVYTRYEWAQKSVEELSLNETIFGHHAVFRVHAITVGAAHDLFDIKPLKLSAGAQLTFFNADNRLDALYGNNPMAGQVYLRLYPQLMKM
jgi:hypothetical protein